MHWRCHTPVCMVMYLMLCIIIEFIGPGKLRIYSLVCLGPETHPVFDGAFSFGLSTHSSHCRPSNRLFTFLREWKVMLAHDELHFIDVSILTHLFGNGMGLVVCNMNITDSFIYAAVKNMIYWGSGVYIHQFQLSSKVICINTVMWYHTQLSNFHSQFSCSFKPPFVLASNQLIW